MDFNLTQEQIAFQTIAREFAAREMAPFAKMWDEESIFPVETLRAAAKLGFGGMYVKSDLGGSALSRLEGAIIFEALSEACASTTGYLSAHNMVAWVLDNYATEEQQKRYLPDLASMQCFGSYGLTEPDAGSDAAALKTTAVKSGDDYVLNGAKCFISGAPFSQLYVCMVRTGEEGHKGISCILVEKDTPGLTFGQPEKKLGWHSQPTTTLFFEDCHVPVKNRIGQEGEGFKIALSALNGGRVNIAACSLGGACYCLEQAKKYMQERFQFKKPLAEFEGLQFKIADMATHLEAARWLVYRAACALEDKQEDAPMLCAMAKRLATDTGFDVCNQALQIFGGYGYLSDYPIERYFRDLRVHQILEGTNEIMRLIVAKRLLNL
jgi:alkylation response protein AidB-like acyl-CoA dehydrogenase